MLLEPAEGIIDLVRSQVPLDHGSHPKLVDGPRAGWVELRVGGVLSVSEDEDDLAGLAGSDRQLDVVRPDRRPPVRDRVSRPTVLHDHRTVPAAVGAEEGVALRIETRRLLRAGEVREMVPALPVLRRVIDDSVHHLDLTGREVPLVVRLVVPRVPETELDQAEQGESGVLLAMVRDPRSPDLEGLAERHEVERLRLDPVAPRPDDRVPEAVPTSVILEVGSDRRPGRGPVVAARSITHVEVAPAGVGRDVVVAVARQPSEPGVAVEGVPTSGVRDDPEVLLAAQVVDPRQG